LSLQTFFTPVAIVCGLVLFQGVVARTAIAASFQPLGYLFPSIEMSKANAVSADGSTVVGFAGTKGFRYSRQGGVETFPLVGNIFAINSDGSKMAAGDMVWTQNNGFASLSIPHLNISALSADGSILAGTIVYDYFRDAVIWKDGELINLGNLSAEKRFAYAYSMSADGSVVAGKSQSDIDYLAYRWTVDTGIQSIGDLPGGIEYSEAASVSADGRVIAGRGNSDRGNEAFRWTEEGGMVALGDLPGGTFDSGVYAANADGSVLVGYANSGPDFYGGGPSFGFDAFIWDEVHGMRSIKQTLQNQAGINLNGWSLWAATGVSADGHTIVGYGFNPQGKMEAWVVTMPEPGGALAIAGSSFVVLQRRQRRLHVGP
jgi:uncharacterized membrane protein